MLQLTGLFFAYASFVILAVGMACFAAPEDRVPAIICAATLVLVWMACEASFTPYSIEQALTGKHDLATHLSAWAVLDTMAALVVLAVGRFRIWATLLFIFLCCGVLNITVEWFRVETTTVDLTVWQSFNNLQDALFVAEEAIFFALGGPKIASLLSRRSGFCRGVFHTSRAA